MIFLREGSHQLSEAGGGKTQRIAMKFGMLVGLGENTELIDELAQRKMFFRGRLPTNTYLQPSNLFLVFRRKNVVGLVMIYRAHAHA